MQTDPGTGVPIATNSVLLGGKGVSLAPPDGFEFTDFLGEAYTYPLPIGPFNMYYEPGAPPSPTSIDRLVPENLSGKKE